MFSNVRLMGVDKDTRTSELPEKSAVIGTFASSPTAISNTNTLMDVACPSQNNRRSTGVMSEPRVAARVYLLA